ncbi:MAG: S-layer homology domain-containing protein [Thermoleophilia bacterium]|nr:S-layer homology domain-containing protein [Thermoleophilia bacterium]
MTRVVWDYEDATTGESHIYLYDSSQALGSTIVCLDQHLKTGTTSNLFADYNDGLCVWMAKTPGMIHYDIYACDIDGRYFGDGATWVRVTNNTVEDGGPITENGKVVWEQCDGNDDEIWLWYRLDPRDGFGVEQAIQLTNNLVDDCYPDLYTANPGSATAATSVVYTHFGVVNNGDIYEWCAPSDYPASAGDGSLRTISASDQDEVLPSISAEGVCWAVLDGNDWEIGWLPTVEGEQVPGQITHNDHDDDYPVIDDGLIVWVSSAGDQPDDLLQTYCYDVVSGRTALVSDPAHLALGPPAVGGGYVAYEYPLEVGVTSDICVGVAMPTSDVPPFSDVVGHPYGDFILVMANEGIVNGYPDGTFKPDNPVLRKHFAKMIVGALWEVVTEDDWQDSNPPFLDCGPDDPTDLYPHDFIAVAKARGYTMGKTASTFAPDMNITRAQMITMVVRAVQNDPSLPLVSVGSDYAGTFRFYTDPTHAGNVKLAEYNGLLDGLVNIGDPVTWLKGNATRGEVALVLTRLQQMFPGSLGGPVPL